MSTSKKTAVTTVTELRAHLPHALREVEAHGERLVIQNHGRGVAALVPLSDLAKLESLERR